MTISQKDGVFNAVQAFMVESGRQFEEGMKVELNRDERTTVIGMLVAATNAGELQVKSPKARADLKEYWSGTLSNWLRKDERLNGNVKHEIKNPGSRAHVGDKQLREMKKLLDRVKGTEDEAEVQAAIDARVAERAAEKAAKTEIDVNELPEALRHLAG